MFLNGFAIESSVFPIKKNPRAVNAIISPGGTIHHHIPRDAASAVLASWSSCPQVGNDGSPKPRKLNAASVRIAAGTAIATLANVSGSNCGIMCLNITFKSDCHISLAASTY